MIDEKTKPKEPDTSDLSYTEGKVLTVDWRELMGEDCEGYRSAEAVDRAEVAEAVELPACVLGVAGVPEELVAINGLVDLYEYQEAIEEAADAVDEYMAADVTVEMDSCQGPMMNYVYTLPHFRGDLDAASKLNGCICLVEFSPENQDKGLPEFGLALTGGGMDLSWVIAGAYVDLGYRPPASVVSRLPEFAGDTMTERKALIIQAMREECERRIQWARNDSKALDHIAAYLKGETD